MFVEFEAVWLHARSKGATTIEGLPHQATVDLPALGLTSTLGAQVHISDAISAGLGLGVGYYFTTGVLRLRHDFTEVRADMDAEALGIHALGIGEIRVGRNLAVEPSMGYRRANARSLRVDEVEVRRADGSRIAPDWSGPVARIALVYYVGGD